MFDDFRTKLLDNTSIVSRPPVVVCSGFHRSGTSLFAQLLHKAGVCMGQRLMQPAFSNPDGHFEDLPVVSLHDQLLAQAGTDWRFHDEVCLPDASSAIPLMESYVGQRDSHDAGAWGFKDPRASLFLEDWARTLGDRGHFLLAIRHWAEALQSLLQRHSQTLAYLASNAYGSDGTRVDLSMWSCPDLLPGMWLAYSGRLLQFALSNTHKVLMVPYAAVTAGLPLHEIVNKEWPLGLKPDTPGIVKKDLRHQHVSVSVRSLVSPLLASQMDRMWARLEAASVTDARQFKIDSDPVWAEDRQPVVPVPISGAIRQRLDNEHLPTLMTSWLSQVDSREHAQDLRARLIWHWLKIYSHDELKSTIESNGSSGELPPSEQLS